MTSLITPSGRQHQQRLAHVGKDVFEILLGLVQLGGPLRDLLLQYLIELAFFLDQPEIGADLVQELVVVDRFEQVVDRAYIVSLALKLFGLEGSGEENDRDVAGLLAQLEHLRRLETVDLGHLHIEDDQVDVRLGLRDLQRLCTAAGLEDLDVHVLLNQCTQREQIVFVVVYGKQFESGVSLHRHPTRHSWANAASAPPRAAARPSAG